VDTEKQMFKDMALLHWESAVIKTLYFPEQMDLMHACESWEDNVSLGKTTVSEYGWSRTRALQEISKKSSELRGKRTDSSSIED
jgi:hypothetical protein